MIKLTDSFKINIDSFIYHIFNYYNGKINICNPCVIEPLYIRDSSANEAGNTWYPNNIKIYPHTISNYSDNINEFYVLIAETIIHELHHADQILFMNEVMNGNIEYINNIECAVEFMTYSYIMSNLGEIRDLIKMYNADITIEDIVKYCNKFNKKFIPYQRKTYVDHVLLSLPAMVPQFGILFIQELLPYFEAETSKVIFNINNNKLIIKDNDFYQDISAFNEFIYNTYFKYNNTRMRKSDAVLNIEPNKDNVAILQVNFEGFNTMARKVDNSISVINW